MAVQNRIFISFAVEDQWAAIRLAGQAKNERSPFEFVDMSVKKPWDEAWKTQCRSRIKGCDGVIVMVTRNTAQAAGALWEVSAAKGLGIPVIGIYATPDNRPASLPAEFAGIRVVDWTWPNISAFIGRL